ncbi:MAG: putative bifunctional diguanylate cyclase/phosphodiesterase [Nodosilinea sp.]
MAIAEPLWQAAFDQISLNLVLVTLDGQIKAINVAHCRFLDYAQDALLGQPLADIIHPNDVALDHDLRHDLLAGKCPYYSVEKRYRRRDNTFVWGRLTVSRIDPIQGEAPHLLIVCEDMIPARAEAPAAASPSQHNFQALLTAMADVVIVVDRQGRFIQAGPTQSDLYYVPPDQPAESLVGQTLEDVFAPLQAQQFRKFVLQVLETGQPQRLEYALDFDSKTVWFDAVGSPLPADQVVIVARDVSDRLQTEALLRHSTLHDGLTDLPNRHLLTQTLKTVIKQGRRHTSPRHTVLFLDLDHFKTVNDSLGHLVGDQLLMAMAVKLQSLVRETDMVARLGGDEFVILLEDDDPMKGAIRIAERLFFELQSPLPVGDREVFLSVSIGIVLVTPAYRRPADLLRDADIAMYRAKAKGKSCYEVFDADMHAYALQRLHLENALHQAVANQEFVLHYQPIFSLQTLQVTGFEALVRWQHPEQGLMGPADFIADAERIGLIIAIDRWVLNTVCHQLAAWGPSVIPSLRVSINLSVQDLWNAHLVDDIDTVLAQTGLTGQCLTLEITESMLISNMEATTRLIHRLRERGIHISIDDFGTGYSSLSYLHQLPADALKIDQSFVNQMLQNSKNYNIIETILTLGQQLGLQVIAEGIETKAQLDALKCLGCNSGQGKWFSPPLSALEAGRYLGEGGKRQCPGPSEGERSI